MPAIFLGAGLEGEAVVVSGGVLAHRGLLPLWGVAAAAAAGSFLVDQLWFLAGRLFRDRAWVQAITRKPAFDRALRLLERHSTLFILGFRFVYGIRTASPIAIGTSQVAARRFVLLNAVAAAVWGPAIALIGYGLGSVLVPLWQRLHDPWLIAAAVAGVAGLAGMAAWLARGRTGTR